MINSPLNPPGFYDDGFYLTDRFIVNPDRPRDRRPPANQGRDNFIADPKTGAIVMVVEADLLPKMKDLIKRLDVPKKMVQIEVMLFELTVNKTNDIGLNLLDVGAAAKNINATSLLFRGLTGITDFIIDRTSSRGVPAFDATYRFLISRDDIQIHATPSVLTVNQTDAIIEIEEEISVNTGTFVIPEGGTNQEKNSFLRARYGIKIDVTPTVHMSEKGSPTDDGINYVTLDSDIKFETVIPDPANNRPNVIRRFISNEARIADGQTVIIGGLRRKNHEDFNRAIPFLGEIPGFGKLFGSTRLHEQTTEMFIFMTPKIIVDPADELECLKMEEMARRPGDIPCFLCALVEARERERNMAFQETMTLLFGREPDRCICEGCEYDGR